MNSHQRKKLACWKHYTMPIGCAVKVRNHIGGTRLGVMDKHDSQRPNKCIVTFNESPPDGVRQQGRDWDWVSICNVVPVDVNRVRPWWRVHNEKARLLAAKRARRKERRHDHA